MSQSSGMSPPIAGLGSSRKSARIADSSPELYLPGSEKYADDTCVQRWQVLQKDLQEVFDDWIERNNSLPDLWSYWLRQMCTVGNVLQLVCAALLVVDSAGVFRTSSWRDENYRSFVEGTILLASLCLMLHLQRASIKRRSIQISSRANRFLQQLQGCIDGHGTSAWPLASDSMETPGIVNSVVPSTRSITNVQVECAEGVRNTPGQLVYKGDNLIASPDQWLTDTFCDKERGVDNSRKVVKTPAAVQLLDLLNNHDAHRQESHFDRQYNECMVSVRQMLIASLLLSVVVSTSHLILTNHRRFFEVLLVRHVNVCLPLLPLSISLLSLLLKVGSNAYLSAMIHELQQQTGRELDAYQSTHGGAFTREQQLQGMQGMGSSMKRVNRNSRLSRQLSVQTIWKRTSKAVSAAANNVSKLKRSLISRSGSTEHNSRESGIQLSEMDSVRMLEERQGSTGPPGADCDGSAQGDGVAVTWSLFWSHFKQRIMVPSRRQAHTVGSNVINPYADLVEAYGSATVLCFPDMDGVLADAVLSPKQIYLPKPAPADGSGVMPGSKGSGGTIIELLAHEGGGMGEVCFEDSGEVASHLLQLKPLGLNCLVNTNAFLPDIYSVFVEQTLRRMLAERREGEGRMRNSAYGAFVSTDYRDMSHLLPPEIGFAHGVQDNFTRLLEVHQLAEMSDVAGEPPKHVMSVIVEDEAGSLQLFSKGDFESVVQSCPQVWDGKELRPISQDDIASITQHHSEASSKGFRCHALSYVSLEESIREIVTGRDSNCGRCIFTRRSATGSLSMYGSSDWEPPQGRLALDKTQASLGGGGLLTLGTALHSQIFLGMLTVRPRPKGTVCNGIETLSEAGIRFVYFSDMPEPQTVAFGHQLGLWSDWNCCISLRDLPPIRMHPDGEHTPRISIDGASSHPSDSVPRPRLPHGINAIRKHIEEADDVPLRVSMFCESDVPSIRSMMGILQENGELVVCCGSSLNMHNMSVFEVADMAVSVGPDPPIRSDLSSKMWRYGGQSHFSTETHLASTFTSIPCTLNLRQGTPLSQIIKIISTSRILLDAMTQSLVFALDASLLLMLTALFGNCLLLPPPLESGQIIFELIAVVPIMMAAVMFSGMQIQRRVAEADPMKMKRVKGNRAKMSNVELRRYAMYCVIRLVPTAAIIVVSFTFALGANLVSRPFNQEPGGGVDPWDGVREIFALESTSNPTTAQSERLAIAANEARHISLILTTVYIAMLTLGCLHRTAPLYQLYKHGSFYCSAAFACVAVLQSIYQAFDFLVVPEMSLQATPLWIWVVGLVVYPVVLVVLGELVRRHDRLKFRKQQQRLTLEFETLLGQTSPK